MNSLLSRKRMECKDHLADAQSILRSCGSFFNSSHLPCKPSCTSLPSLTRPPLAPSLVLVCPVSRARVPRLSCLRAPSLASSLVFACPVSRPVFRACSLVPRLSPSRARSLALSPMLILLCHVSCPVSHAHSLMPRLLPCLSCSFSHGACSLMLALSHLFSCATPHLSCPVFCTPCLLCPFSHACSHASSLMLALLCPFSCAHSFMKDIDSPSAGTTQATFADGVSS